MPRRVCSQGHPLEPVQKLGLLPRALVQDRVGQGEESASRPEVLAARSRPRTSARPRSSPAIVLAQPRLIDAGHVHLPDLFLERHPAQQVVDPLLDRLAGVAVERRGAVPPPSRHCRRRGTPENQARNGRFRLMFSSPLLTGISRSPWSTVPLAP